MPGVIVFAGSNGAGKSTAAADFLAANPQLKIFVNADVIARGLSANNPESVALQAGRMMLQRMKELVDEQATFSFETTLSGKTYARWLKDIRPQGYRFFLHYYWLQSADLAVARVRARVAKGGHHIPEETIRRRYLASMQNFLYLYRPIADEWRIYDNSSDAGNYLIAHGSEFSEEIDDESIWEIFRRNAGDLDDK